MSLIPHKIRVGVLRGGPSPEYEVSLKTGAAILHHMPSEYEPVDIFISKEGEWHEGGVAREPSKILHRVDVVINGLHGSYGEDGKVQNLLDNLGVPYTGSGQVASALAMDKVASKNIYTRNGLKTPVSRVVFGDDLSREAIKDVYESMPPPFVVKPASAGSSVGVYIARSLPELEEAVIAASQYSPKVLIEELILGREATCGVIDGFRGKDYYPTMPIEVKYNSDLFDYNSKYVDDSTEIIIPGNFSSQEASIITEATLEAHRALGLRHYSRSDFIIHPRRGIYILETNTLPGLTDHSFIPKALSAAGASLKEFLSHLINKALGKD